MIEKGKYIMAYYECTNGVNSVAKLSILDTKYVMYSSGNSTQDFIYTVPDSLNNKKCMIVVVGLAGYGLAYSPTTTSAFGNYSEIENDHISHTDHRGFVRIFSSNGLVGGGRFVHSVGAYQGIYLFILGSLSETEMHKVNINLSWSVQSFGHTCLGTLRVDDKDVTTVWAGQPNNNRYPLSATSSNIYI